MSPTNWYGKPYYSLDAYCKNTFKHKCYKVALNAHMTCPNRDGTLGSRGCIFCSAGGSGDFAVNLDAFHSSDSIESQLSEGIDLIRRKLGTSSSTPATVSASTSASADSYAADQLSPCIIAYFQAYTNTYAPVPYLEQVFTSALRSPLVCGISIATRPDCLQAEVLALLASLRTRFPDKFIWVELGLQTIHAETAKYIRRGYELPCFEKAMKDLAAISIPAIVHVILGLPGESPAQMLETIQYLNTLHPFGIKLQLLHVLEHTDLAEHYARGDFETLTKEKYLDILIECLAHLSPDIVVHRVTGDGPKKILIAPKWSCDKRDVLNSLHKLMKERNIIQGYIYRKDLSNVTRPFNPI